MSAGTFWSAVYALAEHVIGEQLSDQARWLIRSYFADAEEGGPAERALYAVQRYTQALIPDLESIRSKPWDSATARLESLLRRLHSEAARLGREYNI